MPETSDISYINSTDYKTLEHRLKELKEVIDDLSVKVADARDLRYEDIDIEGERAAGRLLPDELYVPLHISDTNIRREQPGYVQYVVQSPRAVILTDNDDDTVNLSILEKDLTKKLRFDGWQLSMFANIDGFQANGYSIMEVVHDLDNPGHVGHEAVQYGDFAFATDTRDIQSVEMTSRAYYFSKTKLIALCGDGTDLENDWNRTQVDKVIAKDPDTGPKDAAYSSKEKSLYKVYKNMFKVGGVVQVAWSCSDTCDDWLRKPRPLFIGRKVLQQAQQPNMLQRMGQFAGLVPPTPPQWVDAYETNYPYILYPYLISENDTICQLKGRIFLDQDLQEAVSSLLSSTVTKARRSAGMYFSKDVSDPNDDILLQKNIFVRSGCLINSKVQAFTLDGPDPSLFNSIQMLMTANQNETSQVNFAVNNRKDSRKTAKEVDTAEKEQQRLSTVQVVLFAIALTQQYRLMVDVIRSRVLAGLIKVPQAVAPLYQRNWQVKPSGDVDVIEKQETIQKMMNSWSVVQNTPAAQIFLMDLFDLMFPDRASKYNNAIMQAMQQQQSAQAQQQQMFIQMAQQMGAGLVELSKHKDYFSEVGQLHAYPVVQQAAAQIEAIQKQVEQTRPK